MRGIGYGALCFGNEATMEKYERLCRETRERMTVDLQVAPRQQLRIPVERECVGGACDFPLALIGESRCSKCFRAPQEACRLQAGEEVTAERLGWDPAAPGTKGKLRKLVKDGFLLARDGWA